MTLRDKILPILITITVVSLGALLCPIPTERFQIEAFAQDQELADCTWSSRIGDTNGDGQITPGDALEIFWSSIRGDWQSLSNYCCLDANKDSSVTPGDALMAFWYAIYGRPVEGVTGFAGEPCKANSKPGIYVADGSLSQGEWGHSLQ